MKEHNGQAEMKDKLLLQDWHKNDWGQSGISKVKEQSIL